MNPNKLLFLKNVLRLFFVVVERDLLFHAASTNHRREHFLDLGGSGGSSAARMASSNTFLSPFCKEITRKKSW